MAAKRTAKKKAAKPKTAKTKTVRPKTVGSKAAKPKTKARNKAAMPKAAKTKSATPASVRKAAAKRAPARTPAAPPATSPAGSLAGKAAPAFTLADDTGKRVSLKDFRGRRVILYFYPKDDTPGCTAEACAFRDAEADFSKADAVVLGVSKDNAASHKKFKAKYNLAFPLLADDAGVAEAYGVWKQKSMYGRTYMGIERSTFLIDEAGKVRAEWRKVSVPGHAAEVIQTLAAL